MTILILIVVELCWVVPWYRTLLEISYVASTIQTTVVLGGIMLAGYLLARSLDTLRLRKDLQLAVLAFILIVILVLGEEILLNAPLPEIYRGLAALNPGAVLVLFFVLWMWWRGVALAKDAVRPQTAFNRFELGLFLLMAHVLILNSNGKPREAASLSLLVFFLFVGLLSVTLARISYVGLSQGVRKNPFDRRWLGSTLLILGISVGLATILGGLLTGQYSLLFDWFAEIFGITVAVVIFIFSLPGLILSNFLTPFAPWIRQLLSRPTPIPTQGVGLSYPPQFTRPAETLPLPLAAQVLIFWGVVLLVVALLISRMRQRLGKRRWNNPEEAESLLNQGDARKLFRKALRDTADGLATRLRPVRRRLAAARIRRIYTQLLELCAELNFPRAESQTPLEFLPDLGELFPDFIDDLKLTTEAYVRIRYGELPENEEEVNQIEHAWKRVYGEGQRLKRTGYKKLKTADVKEIDKTRV